MVQGHWQRPSELNLFYYHRLLICNCVSIPRDASLCLVWLWGLASLNSIVECLGELCFCSKQEERLLACACSKQEERLLVHTAAVYGNSPCDEQGCDKREHILIKGELSLVPYRDNQGHYSVNQQKVENRGLTCCMVRRKRATPG